MGGVQFDWDAENVRHLKRHRVTVDEFQQVLIGEQLYLEYHSVTGEERYKVLGATETGRVLIAVWTPREGRVRAVTAYSASRVYQQLYWSSRA
jgi:uncharacterized protein